MRKDAIERILKQGSVKQKIKLYMTDIALTNIDFNNLKFNDKNEPIGTSLLTDKEREGLWESIKDPKDIEYYEKLRTINKVILFIKEHLTVEIYRLLGLYYKIHTEATEYSANGENIEIINDLLELYPNKASREKAFKLALKKTKGWGGKTYQEKGFPKYLEIDIKNYFLDNDIEKVNIIITSCKHYIRGLKEIISRQLPLKPYKDWIKREEKRVISIIEGIYSITSDLEGYLEAKKPGVIKYEDIEVDITEENLEDIKNAGL